MFIDTKVDLKDNTKKNVHTMSSYLLLMTFLPIEFKHCNTDKRIVWIGRWTFFKD